MPHSKQQKKLPNYCLRMLLNSRVQKASIFHFANVQRKTGMQGQSQAGELKRGTSLNLHFQLQLPSQFLSYIIKLTLQPSLSYYHFAAAQADVSDTYLPSGSRSNCYHCCLQHFPLSFFWNHDASFGYGLCCASFNQNTIKQGKEFPKCFSCL